MRNSFYLRSYKEKSTINIMNSMRNIKYTLLALCIILNTSIFAQISAPTAKGVNNDNYNSPVYVFQSSEDTPSGALTASSDTISSFEWEQYDPLTSSFLSFWSESNQRNSSPGISLEDGLYQVTIYRGSKSSDIDPQTYTAWVYNAWASFENIEVSESVCEYFRLNVDVEHSSFDAYKDISTGQNLDFDEGWSNYWEIDGSRNSSNTEVKILNPPAEDTNCKYIVENKYDCQFFDETEYLSIVPESSYTSDPTELISGEHEAPLEVTFTNTSINYDASTAQWFFYKDQTQFSKELEQNPEADSIDFVLREVNPFYSFENVGSYRVKLVTINTNSDLECSDTLYMPTGEYIDLDSSMVDIPNVFSPNGDGINDELMIYTTSVKTLEVMIYNRWGQRIHHWESDNVRSSEEVLEHAVWDGKIRNRAAVPGVYFYVVVAKGRDNDEDGKQIKRKKKGFFHLFI